jgi:hypothetical protein
MLLLGVPVQSCHDLARSITKALEGELDLIYVSLMRFS